MDLFLSMTVYRKQLDTSITLLNIGVLYLRAKRTDADQIQFVTPFYHHEKSKRKYRYRQPYDEALRTPDSIDMRPTPNKSQSSSRAKRLLIEIPPEAFSMSNYRSKPYNNDATIPALCNRHPKTTVACIIPNRAEGKPEFIDPYREKPEQKRIVVQRKEGNGTENNMNIRNGESMAIPPSNYMSQTITMTVSGNDPMLGYPANLTVDIAIASHLVESASVLDIGGHSDFFSHSSWS